MADFRTTPISLQTFMSITDSRGLFKTWTDIRKETLDALPINEDIMGTKIKAPQSIQGNNIIFENVENKNILPFIDDLTKRNNTLTMNKMVMNLYSDFMITLEYNNMDKHSAMEWSQILSDAMSSQMIAKKDFENMLVIDEVMKVCIALGNVALIEGSNELNLNYNQDKALGLLLANDRIQNRTKRGKFMKGFPKALERFLVSPTLSLNLLAGLTAGSAAPQAFTQTEERFQATNIQGHNYETTPMYLGKYIGMSEFTPDAGGTQSAKQNIGDNTGQLVKAFDFQDLQGLLFYNESIAFYGQFFEERLQKHPTKRYVDVITIAFRENAAVKPVYAAMNKAYFSKVPTRTSYIGLDGNVVEARDYSKKADFDKLRNELYQSQPQLYSMFGWDGASNVQQTDIDKIWQKKLDWKNQAITKMIKKLK